MKALRVDGAASRGCGRRRRIPLVLLALLVTLVACGQKGALYLPQKGKPVPAQPGTAPRPATPESPPSTQLPTLPPEAPVSQPEAPTPATGPGQTPQTPDTTQQTPPPDDDGS
jgi:predicted small lipoprotein YifL